MRRRNRGPDQLQNRNDARGSAGIHPEPLEEFVNRNFAVDFVDHGADVPPGTPPGPAGAIQYVSGALKRFPDLRVQIEDMIAEDDKVVVRNQWTATDSQSGKRLAFRGIVIWRIAGRKIVERWAYLEAAHEA